MENIDRWLENFITYWKSKDIDGVIGLFTKDVEYWETSFSRISTREALRREWGNIHKQYEIDVNCRVFSETDGKYAIYWDLEFKDESRKTFIYKGTYLMTLNKDNKCNYFFQCVESDPNSKKVSGPE